MLQLSSAAFSFKHVSKKVIRDPILFYFTLFQNASELGLCTKVNIKPSSLNKDMKLKIVRL